ncbi:hypothetical protein [Anaeromyxobacter diazotrophicus]|nr:hypothetical protein [Anaeromyxobacter diazotrophicus]
MRAALVRVGIDQAFGRWNAPVDPATNEFVYVPIPEERDCAKAFATPYSQSTVALHAFAAARPDLDPTAVSLPSPLTGRNTHLDPDFRHMTYGDSGARRGRGLCEFERGDLVVFYASLRPVRPCEHRLVYAIIGLFRVVEAIRLRDVPKHRWAENAHTRRLDRKDTDIIVRGDIATSGRLRHCIPIGEWRERSYRVRRDLLEVWGDISCRNGFIQRSVVPPTFRAPERFVAWFDRQDAELIAANNPETSEMARAR